MSTQATQAAPAPEANREAFSSVAPTPWEIMKQRARYHLSFQIGAVILIVVAAAAILAPWISPYDPLQQDLTQRLVSPVWGEGGSWAHPFGTDQFGRDVLSRLIHGGRISLAIGVSAALLAAIIGSLIGMIGGYFGGRADAVVMYLVSTKLSLPGVIISLGLIAVFGSSFLVLILVLAFLFWDNYAVALRASVMQLRSQDFIAAAQAVGASKTRIILTEILPNVTNQIIVIFTLEVALAILTEATLSFLGLGVQPPTPSWGLLVSEGRNLIFFEPHLIAVPGLTIFIVAVAINMLGDGIRDITSPEGRN